MNREKFKGHTPGPWRWEFSATGKRLQLCGGARRFDDTVMDFVRVGMGGAGPRVRVQSKNGDYTVIERFIDEPGLVAPAPGREHHKDWFQLVTHPDLLLMQAAPELLAENEHAHDFFEAINGAIHEARKYDEHSQPAHDAVGAVREIVAENERLRARVAELESDLNAAKKWGELWYFVSDEAPAEFQKIILEWTPSRWISEAHKLMASKQS